MSDHNHKISCLAGNEVTEKQQQAQLLLNVKFSPLISPRERTIRIKEGRHLNISCDYYANPLYPISVTWHKNSRLINTNSSKHVGKPEQPWMIIHSVEVGDQGNYSCSIRNIIGEGHLDRPISIEVLTSPHVKLKMDPASPVIENRKQNVTLYCQTTRGNPSRLVKVKWYMDSILLTELPQCQQPGENLCGVDPSKLILEYVNREFEGKYSCVGYNEVGQSPRSQPVDLKILYPPGVSEISMSSGTLYKDSPVNLTCQTKDLGNPSASEYIWLVGNKTVEGKTSKTWQINPVILGTQEDISCLAYNVVGRGIKGSRTAKVQARPRFIQNLPPSTGTTSLSSELELVCQIECHPRCQITWLKDGAPIRNQERHFSIHERVVAEDLMIKQFPSVLSTLTFIPHRSLINYRKFNKIHTKHPFLTLKRLGLLSNERGWGGTVPLNHF